MDLSSGIHPLNFNLNSGYSLFIALIQVFGTLEHKADSRGRYLPKIAINI